MLKRVAALLELRGHTMEEVAEAVGLSVRTVARWLHAFLSEGSVGCGIAPRPDGQPS